MVKSSVGDRHAVAALVKEGLSERQIAGRLSRSKGFVRGVLMKIRGNEPLSDKPRSGMLK